MTTQVEYRIESAALSDSMYNWHRQLHDQYSREYIRRHVQYLCWLTVERQFDPNTPHVRFPT